MPSYAIVSPVDGRIYTNVSILTDAGADAILAQARAAQTDWARLPLDRRITYCRAFIEAMISSSTRIAEELTWQMGRPIAFTPKEVTRLVERAESMIALAEKGLAPIALPDAGDATRRISRVPHGVCLIVAPWNYPYLTAINTVLPALLAGNTVILKPAGQTALTGERLADAFTVAGFPNGAFASALLSHETAARWIGGRKVDFVAFTGSVRGGTEIEHAAAGRFLPITLELGGKDPAYVRADANLDFAAAELVDGAFFNSGQSCCGVERIYVHASRYKPFLDRFLALTAETQKLGDPTNSTVTLGPVISNKSAQTIRKQVADAVAAGASVLHGETRPLSDGPYIPPTVLTGVDHSMEVMTEETFGPVVGIMPVESDEEAIFLMNDSRYGLTASIWTEDRANGERIGSAINTGTVFVNRCDYLDPGLAWVGVKDTGRGCSLSELGFHHVTRPKSYYILQK